MTEHTHTLALIGDPRDVSVARMFTRRFLDAEGLDGEAEDVLLVVSELVTNAIVHGASPITLTLGFEPPGVAVAVTDAGDSDP